MCIGVRTVFGALVLVCLGATLSAETAHALNDQPVIGVLAIPIGTECITAWNTRATDNTGTMMITNVNGADPKLGSCFHSLYVQWLEAAGARVVPIPFDVSEAELEHLLGSLNGILFTGGEVELKNLTSGYMNTTRRIVAHSTRLANASEVFPVWGTCMGFQTLCVLAANDPAILTEGIFDSEGLALPLNLTNEGLHSRLWSGLRGFVQDTLETKNVTCNLHHDGIFARDFRANKRIMDQCVLTINVLDATASACGVSGDSCVVCYTALCRYALISTNLDKRGHEFVSTMEHRKAPIFATQWHPERPQFQFSLSAGEELGINHGLDAIEAMQVLSVDD